MLTIVGEGKRVNTSMKQLQEKETKLVFESQSKLAWKTNKHSCGWRQAARRDEASFDWCFRQPKSMFVLTLAPLANRVRFSSESIVNWNTGFYLPVKHVCLEASIPHTFVNVNSCTFDDTDLVPIEWCRCWLTTLALVGLSSGVKWSKCHGWLCI